MSPKYIIVIVVVVLAFATTILGMPHQRTVDLADAMNQTVCPIQVEIDEDPHRIPKRIKVIKCAPNPTKWCVHNHIPDNECCQHNHNGHVMECVELNDHVLVYYPNSSSPKKSKLIEVSVGCICMIEKSSQALPAT